MIDLVIKFTLGILSVGALTIFVFVMFKLPIKGNDKQIAIISVVLGFVNFYFKDILESSYYYLFQVIAFVLLLIIIRKYPILYALILAITGLIASSFIDTIVTLIGIQLKLATLEQMVTELKSYSVTHLSVTIVYILIALLLSKLGIGFSFVKRRFSGKYQLSNINFLWAFLLIIAMIIMTVLTQPEVANTLNIYILLLVGVIFIISIWFAFKENKLSLTDRYGGNK